MSTRCSPTARLIARIEPQEEDVRAALVPLLADR
jgi:hypothetical protein